MKITDFTGFTPEQLELIASENPEIDFELNDLEVLAIYSLGQMDGKIVRMTDNFFGNTKTGLFLIEQINDNENLDFSKTDDWRDVTINSISVSLVAPNNFGGEDSQTFNDLRNIKSIALFKQ